MRSMRAQTATQVREYTTIVSTAGSLPALSTHDARSTGCQHTPAGQLCGACETGAVLALGSQSCVSVSECDGLSIGVVWLVLILGCMVAAWVQLALVSDVWLPAKGLPAGKLKLVVYFAQAR
jgi:hypothetical protein